MKKTALHSVGNTTQHLGQPRRCLAGNAWRMGQIALGAGCIVLGVPLFPLPLPFGLPFILLGIALMARSSATVRRFLLDKVKRHHRLRLLTARLAPWDMPCPPPGDPCALCGSTNWRLMHEWDCYSIWRCACGLAMLQPFPPPKESHESVPDRWSPGRTGRRRSLWTRFRHRVSRWFVLPSRRRFIEKTRRVASSGRLLDVGCGDGRLIREASRYYGCLGVDPSPYAVRVARENGMSVVHADFETVEFAPGSFDVVVLYAVIEHLRDRLAILRKVHDLLVPHGIVAIQTPNLDGPARWWHGRDWNGFRVGYHLYMFNGDTLARMMEMAGFAVLKKPRRSHFLDDSIILWGRKNDAKDGE